jgi:hypothetical protein
MHSRLVNDQQGWHTAIPVRVAHVAIHRANHLGVVERQPFRCGGGNLAQIKAGDGPLKAPINCGWGIKTLA